MSPSSNLSHRLLSAAPYIVAGIALVLTLTFHFFLAEVPYGIPFAIMLTSCVVGIYVLIGLSGVHRNNWALLFLVPFILVVLAQIIYASPVVRVLGAMVSFVLLVLFAYWTSTPHRSLAHVPTLWPGKMFFETLWPFRRMQQFFSAFSSGGTSVRILIGCVIALPFLLIIGALFASADQLFNKTILDLFRNVDLEEIVAKLIRDVIVLIIFLGTAWTIFMRKDDHDEDKPLEMPGLNNVISATFFVLLNVLFLVFIGFQFAAFFGGETFLRQQGLTYADYAVSGYFQLLAVSAIVFVISWFVYRMTNLHDRLLKWLSFLLILQTGIVITSAITRLLLYVGAYGWTLSRWWAMLTIILIAWVLLTMAIGMLVKFSYSFLATRTFIALMWVLAIVLLVPHEAIITRMNVNRFVRGQGPALDIRYLIFNLSPDAIPSLAAAYRNPAVRDRLELENDGGTDFTSYMTSQRNSLRVLFKEDWRHQVMSDYRALASLESLGLPVSPSPESLYISN